MASVGTIKYKNGSTWVDILHPVGSFYLSTQSTSPSSLFGGTWVQITNAVLRGAAGTGYGGRDTHTLTINEMPRHNHHIERATLKYPGNALSGQGNWVGTIDNAENSWIGYTGGGRLSRNCRVITTSTSGTEASKQIRGEW